MKRIITCMFSAILFCTLLCGGKTFAYQPTVILDGVGCIPPKQE